MSDSLLDIAPLTETLPVSGKQITVGGISMKGVANLLLRFPSMLEALSERRSINAADLITIMPEAANAIIAAGVGEAGNKKVEQKIETLPLGDQVTLLSAVIRLTLPGGFGPLVEQIEAVAAMVGGNVPSASIVTEQLKGNSQDQLST